MAEKPLAIVSGGNGYVGSAIAVALRHAGWNVAVLGRSAETAEGVYRCDITNERDVFSAVKDIIDRYGAVDACIHAAAPPIVNAPLLETDLGSFETPIIVAVRGAFLLAKAAAPHMKTGATFIGITSKLIEQGMTLPPAGSYASAKYGLRGFLRTFASEIRTRGIRVYAVAPGFLAGGLNEDVPPAMIDFLASKSGAGTTTREEVAALVLKLCTAPDAYPTGSSLTLSPLKTSPL